jgi:hypothetical protein
VAKAKADTPAPTTVEIASHAGLLCTRLDMAPLKAPVASAGMIPKM